MKRLFFYLFALILLAYAVPCRAEDSLHLSITPSIAWQGKVISIKLVSAEGITDVEGHFLGQQFKCYKQGPARSASRSEAGGDDFSGVAGVPIDQKPGLYDLKLIVTRKDGTKGQVTKQLKVWATDFPFSKYWLKPTKKELLAPKKVSNDWALIEKVLLKEKDQNLRKGTFSLPVEGEISQGFGHRQIVNGKRSGNHRGVDFAVFNGTEVKAPNKGIVVFKQYLEVFGGTMVLDHGQGIHTLYFHLSKCLAEVGTEVEKGGVIALSGNSGVSSGPHLHWGMSVHNLRVDPMQWVRTEL